MNYRHAFHAGNFADVLKHAVLARVLEYLCRKPRPWRMIDTHAGIGRYDLTCDEAIRNPEWRAGIERLWGVDIPPAATALLGPYVAAVEALNPVGELHRYPGSPALAAERARPDDRVHLCELHPTDAETLRRNVGRDRRFRVECRDGYAALKALLPPKERRGVVVIDPPFEEPDELERAEAALRMALTRWPGGTYIIWRALKEDALVARFDTRLARWLVAEQGFDIDKILRADLWVRDPGGPGGLAGAGVLVLNPPYTLSAELVGALPWLESQLAVDAGSGWRVEQPVAGEHWTAVAENGGQDR